MRMIDDKMKISEIIDAFPVTISVFSHYGFDAGSKERLVESLGKDTMLKTVLGVKRINSVFFINMLNDAIKESGLYDDKAGQRKERRPDLLAYIPCPLKQFFKENLDMVLAKHRERTGISYDCEVPMGCGSKDEFEDQWMNEDIDRMPDIIISMGFGDFFRKEFVDRFVKTGHFKAVLPSNVNRDFSDSGLIDPDGRYTVYSHHPYLFMIDKMKLGNLPVPKTWQDLLNPAYENNIIVGGHGDEISETILLHYVREFGSSAVEKLAGNIKSIWHGAEMAKHAGSRSSEGAAIYVASHFFASTCPRKEAVQIFFPEDGIAASHLYMLVKKNPEKDPRVIIDYLFGKLYGNQSVEQFFPVINGDIKDRVYEGKKIRWAGWDFIRQNDIHTLRDEMTSNFISIWKDRAKRKIKTGRW